MIVEDDGAEPTETKDSSTMLLTLNLTANETQTYASCRTAVKSEALRLARKSGRRFAQIVGADGRILDVLEACSEAM